MFIKEYTLDTWHLRKSKLGNQHTYCRKKTMVVLCCDSCDVEFTRPKGEMSPIRLNDNYFHVCKDCDVKKFAQKKGVDKRKIWKMSASSNLPISKF